MSGGSFDYAYSKVDLFVEDLKVCLSNDYGFDESTKEKLGLVLSFVKNASELMHATEWLYSGDIGEEGFLKRVDGIV